MAEKKRILIVDDDPRLLELLGNFLRRNDFIVKTVERGEHALDFLKKNTVDLIVSDIMMPNMDGYELLTKIRDEKIETPVLMLTALDEADDRIKGLETGADDYLAKPFEPRELLLRIQNILKRTKPSQYIPDIIQFGNFQLDMKNLRLEKSGKIIYLTPAEREILKLLGENFQSPISRETIASTLNTGGERTVDVQMARLRKKIEQDPSKPVYLQTIRHKGYCLRGGKNV